MSSLPLAEGSGGAEGCPLCGTEVVAEAQRCPRCGYALDGVGERPGPFSRAALLWSLMGLVVVYLITLGTVALTN